jgi:hypothetical protein
LNGLIYQAIRKSYKCFYFQLFINQKSKNMKKITIFFAGTILLAAFFATTAFKPLPPGPSANGQGTLTLPGDQSRHFAFHANTMPDGSVQGSGQLTYTGGVLDLKFDINCMTIVGNSARMSGIITSHSTNPALVGTGCYFRVVDNGEGSNSSEDQMTLLFVGLAPGYPCNFNGGALNPIEGGNIQVK